MVWLNIYAIRWDRSGLGWDVNIKAKTKLAKVINLNKLLHYKHKKSKTIGTLCIPTTIASVTTPMNIRM